MSLIQIVVVIGVVYLLLTLFLTFLAHKFPRHPVTDPPDWGKILDTRIPSVDGGYLEVWRIEPEGPSRGVVVLAHGWGRNRDRMVPRARIFGRLGFTTVLHSARDHGHSSSVLLMNTDKFGEDIESVLKWVGEPVILYGHSAGSGGAIIAAARNPDLVKLLFLEGVFAHTGEALLSLYRWGNRFLGNLFGPAVVFWMNMFYSGGVNRVSPANMATQVKMPVMLIHGEKDRRFPLRFALTLKEYFKHDRVDLYVGKGVGHSDTCTTPGYVPAVSSFLEKWGALSS